jgi:hypothetical protein
MRFAAPLIALASLFAALLGWQSAGGVDLLANGGFESGVSGWAWTDGALEPVAVPVHGGAASARYSDDGQPSSHEVYQWVGVSPGHTYHLSAWIVLNDPDVDQVYLRINWFDANGGLVRSDDSTSSLTIDTPAYQFLATPNVDAPQAARSARIGVRVLATSDFAIYLDDIAFDGPAATPTPNPTAPATPTAAPTPTAMPVPTASPPAGATSTPAPTAGATSTPSPASATEPLVFERLTNGSFELSRPDGTPYAWRKFGGEFAVTRSRSVDGSSALAFTSTTGSTKWVYQTLRVEPLAYYQASVHAMSASAPAAAFLRLSWYASEDGSGPAIASDDSTQAATGPAFRLLSTGSVQAPEGAHSVKLRLMLRPGSEAPMTAYFDAVTFSQTDPPAGGPAPGATTQPGGPAPSRAGESARPAIETGVSGTPSPGVLGAVATPVRRANVKPSPAAVQDASALGPGGTDHDWAIALAIVTPLAAFGLLGVYELQRRQGNTADAE